MSTMRAVLQTPAMRWAVGGWSFFIAENVVLSENRDALQQALGGSDNYHLLYGTISTTACASIAYSYFKRARQAPPLLWPLTASPPAARLAVSVAVQALGLAGLSQAAPRLQLPFGPAQQAPHAAGQAPPVQNGGSATPASPRAWSVRCPVDFATERSLAAAEGVRGVERVSRHAGLWSFALTCLGEALIVPSVPQAVCLAMPCMVALIGGAHADSRYARGMGGQMPADYAEQTSNVPFAALLTGKQGSEGFHGLLSEAKGLNAALGVALAVLLTLRR